MKKNTLLIIPMCMAIFSCQPKEKTKTIKEQVFVEKKINSKRVSGETDKEYSAKLARIGEILVTNPVGVAHAHEMFTRALEINPKNNKALLYSAFTGVLMSLEGSVGRTRNLFEDPAQYDSTIDFLTNRLKYPEFVKFITGNQTQAEFKNYQEVKKFVNNNVIDAFEKANKTLNKIDGNVDIILTRIQSSNLDPQRDYICFDKVEDNISFVQCRLNRKLPDTVTLPALTSTVDSMDVKILANAFKAYSAALKLYTAYKITGQRHLTNELRLKEFKVQRGLTDRERHLIVNRYPVYATLEDDNRLKEIIEDLEGVVEATMDLESLNNQFCMNNLRIKNLFEVICFSETARADLEKALDLLSGPSEYTIGPDINDNDVTILVDLPSFINNPLQDLKTLAPGQYNPDGSSNYTNEPMLNGLFPNNDLLEKIKQLKSEQ